MLLLLDQEQPTELPQGEPFDTSAMEVDMGDQAGLKPLPIGRMLRQAGRPMSPRARGQSETQKGKVFWYGKNESLKVDPALHDLTIKRNQKNQQVIEGWNPIEAENKQRLNNTNPNPRSKPSSPSDKTAIKFFSDLAEKTYYRKVKAFNSDRVAAGEGATYGEQTKLIKDSLDAQDKADRSLFLTPQERNAAKSMIFSYLDKGAKGNKEAKVKDLPFWMRDRFPGLTNDMVYEWNARRARQLREGTLDMLEIRRDTIRGI